MATFFVGQRVRILWVKQAKNAHKVGAEGRIVEVNDCLLGPVIYGLDSYPIQYVQKGLTQYGYGFSAEQLEPILPEGHTPSVYSYEELMDKCREGVAA